MPFLLKTKLEYFDGLFFANIATPHFKITTFRKNG
jgi:hypothetical protein